jgi:regulator of protease activity HflC (stomatin/prohibitin superfamily)
MRIPSPQNATEEIPFRSLSGYLMLVIAALLVALALASIFEAFADNTQFWGIGFMLLFVFTTKGFYMLQPNQAALLMLFGDYRGTDFSTGLRWTNPFMSKQKISLRFRNFISERLKVNDKRGNPIEIAAAVVWKVQDTARAVLDVDHYEAYVPIQAESAIRHLASEHSYDHSEDAPEIAGAMLRRQQAEAVISARKQIVLGAVSMVEMALDGLRERGIIDLNDERRAAMVSNLLVVLCAESEAQPVINAGTLYQ